MTCARTVSGVGAAAQTAESIALSSQVGSASWATTAEMGAIEAKVFLFAAFAPHPLHACKGSVRFGGGGGRPESAEGHVLKQWLARRNSPLGCSVRCATCARAPPPLPASRVHPVSISLLAHVPLADPRPDSLGSF